MLLPVRVAFHLLGHRFALVTYLDNMLPELLSKLIQKLR